MKKFKIYCGLLAALALLIMARFVWFANYAANQDRHREMIFVAMAGAIIMLSFAALPIFLLFLSIWRHPKALEREEGGFSLVFDDFQRAHVEKIRLVRRIGKAMPVAGNNFLIIKADARFYLVKDEVLNSCLNS